MWPSKLPMLTATIAVMGICLVVAVTAETAGTAGTAGTTGTAETASTASLAQSLQPPTGETTPTTTTSLAARSSQASWEDRLSDSVKELNKQALGTKEPVEDLHYGSELEQPQEQQQSDPHELGEQLLSSSVGFLPTVLPTTTTHEEEVASTTIKLPTNGHGYIQFEIADELPVESSRRQKQAKEKTATVNEVLSNLFPNGFSDIFRFSYPSTTTESATEAYTSTPATTTSSTTSRAVVPPTQATVDSSSTVAAQPGKNQTYSYQTTVTKEYRRELRPGHTEIVVEKIARLPTEQFKDGSNHISKDDLLRINRAAVAAPVLPSLLLSPISDDNETLVAAESAPIVILGEHETELDEAQSIEDNQIAETQQLYHRHLPPGIESYRMQQGPAQGQQVNVHIVHDVGLAKAQEGESGAPNAQPATKLGQALDHYQAHSEQRFQERHPTQEAPSRQFLKNFKPGVSSSADSPIPKGAFHYEVNSPPQKLNTRPPAESDYAGPYVRPAAQLAYQRELSHTLQQQQPQLQPQPQAHQPPPSAELGKSQLHTQIFSSPIESAQEYQGYGSSKPADATPNSLVFVTLNTPSPHAPPAAQQAGEQTQPPAPHLPPSPYEYVAEAAAEPSQQHAKLAPLPQPQTKPNGYTFVEVQKSVNIHNKLITEKDGRLVEQHETIYHQPSPSYNHNKLSADFSPKDFVSAAASPVAPPSQNYVSLNNHPINVQHVEYDSSPQEGAISHASIQIDTGHAAVAASLAHPQPQPHQAAPVAVVEKLVPQPYAVPVEQIVNRPVPIEKFVDRPYPVKQIVEKHIPVPYAVPQPVPVPVHVEHYVDRPYPVETIIEQPVPYPVETIVEKVVEKHVPVEVERIVEKPIEKVIEKFVDRPMAIPIHVPVAIHMPMAGSPAHSFGFHAHPNALPPWTQQHTAVAHVPPKVLQNYYTRMLKKLLPQLTAAPAAKATTKAPAAKTSLKALRSPLLGDAPKVASFTLADMRYDLRPPPPPQGSPWLQGARYIYNTLPMDLATAAASAPAQMVKSYIGPVPAASSAASSNEFEEYQRWRNGHTLKRSPDFGRNLHMEYGFKPPLVPSMEIDDKGNPLKQPQSDAEPQ